MKPLAYFVETIDGSLGRRVRSLAAAALVSIACVACASDVGQSSALGTGSEGLERVSLERVALGEARYADFRAAMQRIARQLLDQLRGYGIDGIEDDPYFSFGALRAFVSHPGLNTFLESFFAREIEVILGAFNQLSVPTVVSLFVVAEADEHPEVSRMQRELAGVLGPLVERVWQDFSPAYDGWTRAMKRSGAGSVVWTQQPELVREPQPGLAVTNTPFGRLRRHMQDYVWSAPSNRVREALARLPMLAPRYERGDVVRMATKQLVEMYAYAMAVAGRRFRDQIGAFIAGGGNQMVFMHTEFAAAFPRDFERILSAELERALQRTVVEGGSADRITRLAHSASEATAVSARIGSIVQRELSSPEFQLVVAVMRDAVRYHALSEAADRGGERRLPDTILPQQDVAGTDPNNLLRRLLEDK